MKPFLSISLLTWMCLFGITDKVKAQATVKQSAAKQKFIWHTDFNKASSIAKQSKKKLFILFTGSDWCPPCQMLKNNVLNKAAFQSAAMQNYVFVMCDFPNAKPTSRSQQAHNDKLAEFYKVESYPSVVLASAEGIKHKIISGYDNENVTSFRNLIK